MVEQGGFVPGGEHTHDNCAEHLAVRSGEITFLIDGKERTLGAGEDVFVPPGTWHRWWNPGEGEVALRVTVEPALSFEEAIQALWGLCADGRTNAEGRPPLLSARWSLPDTAARSATGDLPTSFNGSCFRRSRRSRGDEDWSGRSIVTPTQSPTPRRSRGSGVSQTT